MPDAKKIRVLHIITRLDPGGSTVNTLETVMRLDRRVYEVDLLAGRTSDASGEAAEFIRRHELYCVFMKDLVREVSPLKDLAAFLGLCAFIRRGKYDIVHTHSSKAGILGRWAARVCGVRHVVHTPHGHVFYGYFPRLVTRLFLVAERWSARITDRLIALTQKGIEEHVALGVGRREQWSAIPSGIDIGAFVPSPEARRLARQSLGLSDEEIVFISAGRLDPVKDHSTLIEAMALLLPRQPRARLVIVGDGEEREKLAALCADRELGSRVLFTGLRRDVAWLLNAGDVFVLASLNEGMGRAVLEAMAAGLPVIASRTGGIPSIVTHGKEGFLVVPGQVDLWVSRMNELAAEAALRRAMGDAGRRRVGEEFDVRQMVRKIEEVYRTL